MHGLLAFVLLLGLPSGFAEQTTGAKERVPSHEKPKAAKVEYLDKNTVLAKGVWRPDHSTKANEPVEAVTQLSCFRQGGGGFVATDPFCLQATATMVDKTTGLMDVDTEWLKVVEWSETEIIAVDDSAICLTSQTIFDLKRKTVIALDVRKPEARGLRGMCDLIPDRQTYYLQDQLDYYARKSVAR